MILADSMCFSCWIKTQKPEDMKLLAEVSHFFFPHPPLSSEQEKVGYASGRNSTFFVVKLVSVWTYFCLCGLTQGLVTCRVEKHPSLFL